MHRRRPPPFERGTATVTAESRSAQARIPTPVDRRPKSREHPAASPAEVAEAVPTAGAEAAAATGAEADPAGMPAGRRLPEVSPTRSPVRTRPGPHRDHQDPEDPRATHHQDPEDHPPPDPEDHAGGPPGDHHHPAPGTLVRPPHAVARRCEPTAHESIEDSARRNSEVPSHVSNPSSPFRRPQTGVCQCSRNLPSATANSVLSLHFAEQITPHNRNTPSQNAYRQKPEHSPPIAANVRRRPSYHTM